MPTNTTDVRLFFRCPVWLVIHGHRIIEIEWAVKNDKDYVPSPKPVRKPKTKKRAKSTLARENAPADDAMEVDDCGANAEKHNGATAAGIFGTEMTNTDSPNKIKRSLADTDDLGNVYAAQTPMKRRKLHALATPIVDVSSEDEAEILALPKKSRRALLS